MSDFIHTSVHKMRPKLQNEGQPNAFYPNEDLVLWFKEDFDSYWSSNLNSILPLCLDFLSVFCSGHSDNQEAVALLLRARLQWVVDLQASMFLSPAEGSMVPKFLSSLCQNNDYVCNTFELKVVDAICEQIHTLLQSGFPYDWLAALRNLCSTNGVPCKANCQRVMDNLTSIAPKEFDPAQPIQFLQMEEDALRWHAEFVLLMATVQLRSECFLTDLVVGR